MGHRWDRVNAAQTTKTATDCLLSAEFLNFDIDTEINYIVESANIAMLMVVLSNSKETICLLGIFAGWATQKLYLLYN